MAANEVVLTHLNAARAELEAQRAAAEAGIRDIDRLIRSYSGGDSPRPQRVRVQVGENTVAQPTMADLVLDFMERDHRQVVPALDIVAFMQAAGWGDNSIRSQLVKMSKRGSIVRVGRGMYALPGNAEAPVAAGASETEGANGAPSRQEGDSDVNGTELPRGGDHSPDKSGW